MEVSESCMERVIKFPCVVYRNGFPWQLKSGTEEDMNMYVSLFFQRIEATKKKKKKRMELHLHKRV